MIPAGFDYHAPATLSEAVTLLSRYGEGAKVLSGGQSLLPLLKLRLGHAEHLVDIGRIPGLEYVKASDEHGVVKVALDVLGRLITRRNEPVVKLH